MDHFKLANQIEGDFQNLPYGKVMELRNKMANQIADIDLTEPIEDIKRWYRDYILRGMESDGYLNDSLSTLIYLYLSAVCEQMDMDWKDKAHFWQYLEA